MDEIEQARLTATHALRGLSAHSGIAGDLSVIRRLRSQLLPALAHLLDDPASAPLHGRAREVLDRVAASQHRPELALPVEF